MILKYKCPVCEKELFQDGKSYKCIQKHNFDIAKEGYVNFALGKSDSGDSAEMCASRRSFLSKGYYSKFSELICNTVKKYSPSLSSLIDAGCGEGYYLRMLRDTFPDACLFGIDLAKNAVRLASKSEKNMQVPNKYAVCGIYSLPFFDCSADAVLSVFAPVGDKENLRILKDGGYMFVAGPGKRHLSGLKEAIYDAPYENSEKLHEYDGFEFVAKESTEYSARIEGEDILDLFTMTPYYWKTSRKDSQRLSGLAYIDTELSFEIFVYRKINKKTPDSI